LVVSPGQAPASNPYGANAAAGNLETASRQESYRVMVQADNRSQQNQLRSLYPEAFSTRYGGQSLWQIGVFSSRNNADSALQSVESLGLQGKIIQH
jgi:O-acetylhomoserine/O-acetylserine sulfhydrylase-like pyridoxal-dependent enzyme